MKEGNLSEAKRTLLEQRLKRTRGSIGQPSAALAKRPPGEPMVASLGQQRIWLLHQLDPTSPGCSITNSFHIKGKVDIDSLERSINLVIQRHEVLRSTFSLESEVLIQTIQSTAETKIERIDADTIGEIKTQFQRLVRVPFILDKSPLVRVLFGQSKGDEAILTLVTHDIIFDKWSLILFWKEVGAYYQAYQAGLQLEIEPLTIQYQDFAYKQCQQVKEGVFENQLNYWKEKLRQLPDPLSLPTDRPYPAQLTSAGRLEKWIIPKKNTQRLKDLAKQSDASLFTVLIYGLKVLLHCYTGQENILVGTPIANRRYKETANLIGFFLNTLCIRSDLSDNPTLMEGLLRTKQITTEAAQNQDLPLDWIVDNIELERVAGRHPLFQVMFVYQREDEGTLKLELGSAELEYIFIETQTAKFDFTLFVAESGSALDTVLEYRTDLFDASTMHRMLCHYEVILAQLVENPQQKLSELNYLTNIEREEVLRYGKGEQISFEHLPLVLEQVTQQAHLNPKAIAIQGAGKTVTYEELQARIDRFASHLIAQGIKPGDYVGLLIQRSPDAIVALLAVMKMGAVYLPVDPEYPKDRIRFMLEDADVSWLVTVSDLLHEAEALSSGARCTTEAQVKESNAENEFTYTIKPDDKAYIIYTSGSTGKPKGVPISHDNLRNSTAARVQYYPLKPERFLLIPSLSFDSSVAGIFWTLTTGGTLILPEQTHLRDPDAMLELITNTKVDSLLCVPSLYQQWLAYGFDQLKSLKTVIVAGERCASSLVQQHLDALPECQLFNEYGPTEATVWSTVAQCTPKEAAKQEVPIGKPIANCTAYVLDSHQRLLPVGFPGELYLGGKGIAEGYLNRPELSKERFVTTGQWGSLYRTGDRVKWDASGQLHFLGRDDDQVKIRGYRIELGEVEAALLSHPDIEEAVVLSMKDSTQLAAFVKYRDAINKPSNEEIFSYLDKSLPSFMAPSQVTAVDSWPRTANGKIDREALLEQLTLQITCMSKDEVVETKSNESEDARKLLQVWRDTLGNPNIGLKDNFFQMGGDSILAIQTISKARQVGISLTVNQLFAEPTVAQLVSSPSQQINKIKAEQNEVSGAIGLTPIQHWFLEQNLDDPDWWNQSLLLEVRYKCELGDMEKMLNHLFRHHDGFRAKVSKTLIGWRSFINRTDAHFELDHLDLSETAQEEHEALITKLADTMHQSMRLNSGCLLKAAFIKSGDDQYSKLLLIAHHWAVDMVSWGIIEEDLNTLARQYDQELPFALPDKTTSIQAWVDNLQFFAQSESIARELSFWEGQPYSEYADIPLDFNQEMPNDEGSTRIIQLSLSAEKTAQLKAKSMERGYSLQKILLTSVTHALLKWTQQRFILVGLEGHGREEEIADVDLTRTVGWFTSYFPVVLELDPKAGIDIAVREISAQLDEIPRKGIGFGVLKYLSDHSKELRKIAAPQVIFNYLGHSADYDSETTRLLPLKDRIGVNRNPESSRAALFEVNAIIRNDSLQLLWQYSEHLHAANTIEGLVEKVRIGLGAITYVDNDNDSLDDFDLDEDDLNVLFGGS